MDPQYDAVREKKWGERSECMLSLARRDYKYVWRSRKCSERARKRLGLCGYKLVLHLLP